MMPAFVPRAKKQTKALKKVGYNVIGLSAKTIDERDLYADFQLYCTQFSLAGALSAMDESINIVHVHHEPAWMLPIAKQMGYKKVSFRDEFFLFKPTDMEKLFKEFQAFYRRNSEAWLDRYEYKESAHHLLLMAFLQRVINAGGEIIREMAAGNGRIDMLVRFGRQEFALELKIKRDNHTIEEGKKQLHRYLDKLGLDKGYLVIFDPADIEWEKKLYLQETIFDDKTIIMVGL